MDGSISAEKVTEQQSSPEGAEEAIQDGPLEDGQVGPDMSDPAFPLRLLEAFLFASTEPVTEDALSDRLPEGSDVAGLLSELAEIYRGRGIELSRVSGRWAFRTAADLAPSMHMEIKVPRKLSRASVETLAIIAYHQPVTRGEIEEIRGVGLSKGTLDLLLEIDWIRPVGRKKTPGRPVTWGTSPGFLDHFNLDTPDDLPGMDELKAAGLLDKRPARSIFGETGTFGDQPVENPIAAVDEEEPPEPLNSGEVAEDTDSSQS
jgi:segregation and condensation protein B